MRVTSAELCAGVALDWAFGDPQWLPHPVRALGWFAGRAERFWRGTQLPPRLAGTLFWFTAVGSAVTAVRFTAPRANVYWIYALLACRDLDVQSAAVMRALERGDLAESRRKLAWIVGRDTGNLKAPEIARATVETVAENLSDGVIAPLFYLALAGPTGMAAYKAINTLDSMVGYRNERYRDFGWASARLDDAANFLPSRITALLVWLTAALPGFSARQAMRIALRDGVSQPSPNAGYPEAAMAGALGVQLGGLNHYQGVPSMKPLLGDASVPLTAAVFPRVRVLLYAAEVLLVAAILGCKRWR